MKMQEVFDKVVTHLLTQNAKSLSGTGGCVYRGCDGLMCAVGVLISDQHYSSKFEGRGVLHKSIQDALIASGVEMPQQMQRVLAELQGIHDTYEPCEWREKLKALATDHNLEWKHEA